MKKKNLALELLNSSYHFDGMVFTFSHYCDSMIYYRSEYIAKGIEVVISFNPDEVYVVHETMTVDHEQILDEGIESFNYQVYELTRNQINVEENNNVLV